MAMACKISRVSVKKCESAVKEKTLGIYSISQTGVRGSESLRFGIEDRTLEGLLGFTVSDLQRF